MKPVERSEVEGVDYGWVMQTTFVVTIVVGAPIVAALSTLVTLDTWGARVAFAVRVGAPIWFLTAVAAALYAKRTGAGDGNADLGISGGNDDAIGAEGDGDAGAGDETTDATTDGNAGADPHEGVDEVDVDDEHATAEGRSSGSGGP